MSTIPKWRRYLRFWGPDLAADVNEEFRFHLEAEIEELVARGMSPEAARADALRRFGDVDYYARYCRTVDARRTGRERRLETLDVLRQDLRYTMRSLLRQPGFTIVAVLTLALGIGANTAIFSVVNGVLLSPLAYREPDRLVMLWETMKSNPQIMVSYPDYLDWRQRTRTFEDIAIYDGFGAFNMTGHGDPERVQGGLASGNLFSLLGIGPAIGRLIGPLDDRPGADRVAVLTDGFWRRRFGADPAMLGRSIVLDGNSYTIVGVLPETFRLAGRDVWIPIGLFIDSPEYVRENHPGLIGMGRLEPGITLEQMQQDLDRVTRQIREENPVTAAGIGASGAPIMEITTGRIKPALLMLTGAVGLVLLIACANVANLQLGRAAARQKEFALRVAIGAGRGRLIRQLLTESVLIAIGGGALGLGLAWAGVKLLVRLRPSNVPRLLDIHVDATVLAFALGVSVLTGLAFGVLPALQSARSDPLAALREDGRGATGGRARRRVRAALTVSEVALALMLLIGAGLLLRSFAKLTNVDTGVDPRNVMAAFVQLPAREYPDEARQRAAFEALLARVRPLPELRSVALTTDLPLTASWQTRITFEGRQSVPSGDEPLLNTVVVSSEYFRALGVRQVAGRGFTATDTPGQPPVVVLSESVAKRVFGAETPVGRRLKHGGERSTQPWTTIVGVVAEVKNEGLATLTPRGTIYYPFAQSPTSSAWLVVRSEASMDGVGAMLRRELAAIDPNLPLASVRTLESEIDRSRAQPKFSMLMLSIFAGLALVLAAVGLYGVISHGVTQRSREIGVRIALGAQRRDVLGMVVGQAMALTVAGIVIGGAGALAGGRVMAKLLFDVKATDPLVFAGVIVLLATVALIAATVPALRASRTDPTAAMRGE